MSEPNIEGDPMLEPLNEHNRALLEQVHPPAWKNPTPQGPYNLVVIGGGTAGLVTAAGAAGLGAKVALIERRLLGGECLNVGCVPSKALIRASRAAAEVRDAGAFGVKVAGAIKIDSAAAFERMRRLRAELSPHDSAARFHKLGVDVYFGAARFTGPRMVTVEGQTLKFAKACIATGSRPALPDVPGLAESGYLTNETVFSLTAAPGRLAIIGSGAVGSELAQAFVRLGSEVTLIQRTSRILSREDPETAALVAERFKREGVNLLIETSVQSVSTEGTNKVLRLVVAGQTQLLQVDALLVATGRQPNVDSLDCKAAGVKVDDKLGIDVNDYLQTTNRHIYAAGDVCSQYKLTHAADAMARIVVQNALFFGRKRASKLIIPRCTFTDPEVAHVGIEDAEAKTQAEAIETIHMPLSEVDRAVLDGETEGWLKVFLRRGSDKILGATLVSRHAGETIAEIVLAMQTGKGLKALSATIHPYPTQAEVIKKAADAYNRTRLTPRLKEITMKLLAWRR